MITEIETLVRADSPANHWVVTVPVHADEHRHLQGNRHEHNGKTFETFGLRVLSQPVFGIWFIMFGPNVKKDGSLGVFQVVAQINPTVVREQYPKTWEAAQEMLGDLQLQINRDAALAVSQIEGVLHP